MYTKIKAVSFFEGGVSHMSPTRMAKIESAMRIVLEFNEAFNRHDVAGMMQLMSNDCVFENTDPAPDGTLYSGKQAVTQFWQGFFRESPQAHIEIEEIFGLGNRCILRWKYNWVDADGKKGHVRGVDIFQVKEGFISEKFSYVKG
jgi:ketosteroid isomerase-like protein